MQAHCNKWRINGLIIGSEGNYDVASGGAFPLKGLGNLGCRNIKAGEIKRPPCRYKVAQQYL